MVNQNVKEKVKDSFWGKEESKNDREEYFFTIDLIEDNVLGYEISKNINPIFFKSDRIDQGSKVIFAMLSNIDKHEYVVRIVFGNAKNYFLRYYSQS